MPRNSSEREPQPPDGLPKAVADVVRADGRLGLIGSQEGNRLYSYLDQDGTDAYRDWSIESRVTFFRAYRDWWKTQKQKDV